MSLKTYRNILVYMLVTALAVTSFPSYGLAEISIDVAAPDSILEQNQPISEVENSGLPQGYIVSELPEERERSTKQFLLDNGTYEAVLYPNPVHYMENGIWQDIDNRLIESDSMDKTGKKVYKNNKNEFSVELSKSASSKKTLLVAMGDYQLEWGLEGTAKSAITLSPFDANAFDRQLISEITGEKDSKMTGEALTGEDAVTYKNEKIKTLTNLEASVTYASVFPSVDLEYVVQSNQVKENLILQTPTDISTFNFNLNLKNLNPVIQKDGSIWFFDPANDKEPIFVMQAPYMYDAKGEISNEIAVTLEEATSGYVVSVTPDEKWLRDEDRAYPVTIDPPITTSLDRTDIYDAHVSQGYPTTNYQNSTILKTGYGTASLKNQTLIKFTLPQLASGSMVTNAQLYLRLYSPVSTARQVDVHKVTSAWSSASVTWNTKPTYATTVEDYDMVDSYNNTYACSFEITSIAKDWYTTGSNNGILLRNKDESTGYTEYLSSDCSDTYAADRPCLSLYYLNNAGLEGYWTYHSQDLGRSGTGYINDYNGNLVFTHTDVSMSGNRVPITVQHVYNSEYANSASFGYGNGWRTNYNQRLLQTSIGGTS